MVALQKLCNPTLKVIRVSSRSPSNAFLRTPGLRRAAAQTATGTLHSLQSNQLESTAQLARECGVDVISEVFDITQNAAVSAFIPRIVQQFGKLDRVSDGGYSMI